MLNVKFGNGSFEFDSTILVIYLKKLSYQKKYIYILSLLEVLLDQSCCTTFWAIVISHRHKSQVELLLIRSHQN